MSDRDDILEMEPLLTVDEVARIFNIKGKSLRLRMTKDPLSVPKFVNIGGEGKRALYRFEARDVKIFLNYLRQK